ncbi:phosphonate C-P lyase system protein PhnH [Rhizobiaceae bacterium BDR2-2]|uniref:Phosphonate C-P lyase system protein PhnH n=1 Tax=Ectorhizobium quercum TaxID=2965071 RepID=A0AAE3SUU2_9HYPH|nr:phosphonate C-P lyase system protein PhnH [Ectorhizobium quercum]MCX8995650.1 phosphonate C-P lyase system protein PhnH [Ectorhizobium quercum]
MGAAADTLAGGFHDPVFQGQAVFRLVMDGMARPGTLQTVTDEAGAPAPLGAAAGAIALTLLDHDTPVWLSAGLQKSSVPGWLAFHTGAPPATEKTEARFAFLEADAPLPAFGLFSAGTQDYPDRSATLIIEIGGFDGADALKLSGPGIAGGRLVHPESLPEGFLRQWAQNHALFPRGMDIVLTAGDRFLCLPRTTRISAGEL